LKLSELLPHLLWANSSEHDLIKAVEELSENFTKDRSKINTYLSDPRLVSAYTAFYLSTNVPKLEAVLKWLKPSELQELKDYELIDVGAGPGTFSLAWRELIGTKSVMIETSSVMREQAKKLFQGLYQEEALFDLKQITKKKLLLFGHSLNEMGLEAGVEYLQKTNPDKVWMIEPGTKEMFQLALKFREKMLKLGWSIRFPCPSSSSCPMEGSDDWCHQFLNVRHSDDVERLTQLAGRDRRNLPITVMMFEKKIL
jgi:ribosomal protein RSM22 (predicted rRNA methylase)